MHNYMGIVWSILTFILAIVLIYFVVQGVLYIGWAFGGVIGFILALLIIFGVLEASSFFAWILGVIAVIFLLDWFF